MDSLTTISTARSCRRCLHRPAMWKRATSLLRHHRSVLGPDSPAASAASASGLSRPQAPAPLFFSTLDAAGTRTRVEDVMPIATGLEREEIEAELQGKKRFDMDVPVGPFGTKLGEGGSPDGHDDDDDHHHHHHH